MSRARSAKRYFVLPCYLFFSGLTIFAAVQQQQAASATTGEAIPSQAEQDRMLAVMRDYAGDYTAKLPNFICQQVVYQFEAGRKPTRWHKGDTLTSKLVFNAGKEERRLEAVNDKPVSTGGRSWRAPLTTAGEFGMWLSNIFDPVTQTRFTWGGWEQFGGRRIAKFDYSVSQEHSTLSLSLSDLAKALVAYHGSVYADPETGAVYRIASEANDIPEKVRTRSTATTIEYDAVKIGAQSYLLPVKAQVLMVTDTNHIRNEMVFQSYRKFEAESTITFGDSAEQPHQ
jgi:hypothetical protein